MSTHQYWRILYNAPASTSGIQWGIEEMQWKSVSGGTNLATTPANATADGSYSGSYLPGNAIDGNTSTSWVDSNNGAGSWWSYNFGSPVDIVEITLTGDGYHTCPSSALVQHSDDNSTWTTGWAILAPSGPWTTGTQTFTKNSIYAGGHRYWRVLLEANAGGNGGAANLAMHTTVGGANICVSGNPISDSAWSSAYVPYYAFDNTITTEWVSSASPPTSWIGFDFGEGQAPNIVEIVYTTRDNSSYTQGPTTGYIQYSDNGTTWTTSWTFTTSWTSAGQAQTFANPAAGAPARQMFLACGLI